MMNFQKCMNFMFSLYAFSEAEKVQRDTVKTEKLKKCNALHYIRHFDLEEERSNPCQSIREPCTYLLKLMYTLVGKKTTAKTDVVINDIPLF